MAELKYIVIKSDEQYLKYCNILEELVFDDNEYKTDEIELLTILVEHWDNRPNPDYHDLDPVQLLKSFMNDHHLRAINVAKIIGVRPPTVSKMLNYQKGFSKESIRLLSKYFKVNQSAFNREYVLHGQVKIVESSEGVTDFYEIGGSKGVSIAYKGVSSEKVSI